MNLIELISLALLGVSAVGLVVLGIVWDVWDRRPLDPPLQAPAPEVKPRHAAWGETTRLMPPD